MVWGIEYFCFALTLDSDYFKVHMVLFVLFIIHCLNEIDFLPIGVKPEDTVNHKRYSRIKASTALISKINEQAYRG